MGYLEIFEHLLPRSPIWRLSVGKNLRKLFEGLSGSIGDARENADQVWATVEPQTTNELPAWENQFGLWGSGSDPDRRASVESAWAETGGQSPTYLQQQLQAAGFSVYVHQWWTNDPPFKQVQCGQVAAQCGRAEARCSGFAISHYVKNPFDYTSLPLIGSTQCGQVAAQCGRSTAVCSATLKNEPGYIVNETLTDELLPPIPTDTAKWRYFLYWGAATFPNRATVPAARELEFKQKILKLCPTRDWLVLLVDFV